MTDADDMESLMAQMEREYEEAELKKKAEKKSRKKGVKVCDGGEEGVDKVLIQDNKKEPKKNKKEPKSKNNNNDRDKKQEDLNEQMNSLNIKSEDSAVIPSATASAAKKNKKKEVSSEKKTESPENKKKETLEEPELEKSDKKSKKGSKKDEKPKKKLPSGVSALKEALAAANKVEEDLKKAEEDKQRKEEEARKAKAEQERLEKERKDKKKQKEKERIARKKLEGTFETKEQKEARQRALLQLQAMGVTIPSKETETEATDETVDSKKVKPKYGRLRKNKANVNDSTKQIEVEEITVESKKVDGETNVAAEEEEVLDSWDIDEEELAKQREAKKVAKLAAEKQKAKAEVENTGDGDNDEDAESDSEDEDESADEEESEESSDEDETETNKDLSPMERARLRIQKRHVEAEKLRSVNNLRSPVICVLGHVDTGKTKILDNLRRTKVQDDEAGGITQQIGATNVPLETIIERTKMATHIFHDIIKIPGLLIIDTPGHEAFKSLRTRGSSLCDIAILVIDIMHGLEPQTIESIHILKEKKTPFLVALNKIDRLFDWKTNPNKDIVEVLESQPSNTKNEFERRSEQVIMELAEQGLNAALYYKNKDIKNYISLVPTSAHSSDGIGNLMALLIEFSQTILAKRVSYSSDLQCTVMEVKAIPGLGTTVDVCLVNGKLKVADTIVLPGQEGPIVTQVRGLLTPQPNRDLRVKNHYVMNKELLGARGVKLAAKELEKCMAGLPMFVAQKPDEIEYYKEELNNMLKAALSSIKLSEVGVFVQASTLGSLEALLEFLKTSKIPYAGISIGPVHRKDVIMASIMLEKDPQYAVILSFDVKVEKDAQDHADHVGVKIFTADIIYHLFDKFIGYRDELKAKKREEFKDIAVFPFKLKILPEFIFNTRDPIIIGVKITNGFLKIGSPICAMCLEASSEREGKDKFVDLGRITSIEYNHKPLEVAKMGQDVCIKIENTTSGAPKLLGRHFLITDQLVSKISRDSIDAVKNYFREEMTKADWQLIIELKRQFQII